MSVLLAFAILVVGPFLALMAFYLGREALRARRPARLAAVIGGAIALEVLAILPGTYQVNYVRPASVNEGEVPGTYSRLGEDARDEVVLSADGTFFRTAPYRGVTQQQQGRWSHQPNRDSYDVVSFEALVPPCLRSTERPGGFFHLREPDELFCAAPGGRINSAICRVAGQLALCLGDEGVGQGPLLNASACT